MKLHFRPALALSLILVIFLTSLGLTVTAQAQTYSASSGIEYDHFIIYKGADGDTVCREATLAEKRDGEWRIADRVCVNELTATLTAADIPEEWQAKIFSTGPNRRDKSDISYVRPLVRKSDPD